MKNGTAQLLLNAKRKGVEQGEYLMAQVCLIALENQINLWGIPVDDSFFRAVENDIASIRSEVLSSVPSGEVKEMAEKLVFIVNDLRKKRGMTPLMWTE